MSSKIVVAATVLVGIIGCNSGSPLPPAQFACAQLGPSAPVAKRCSTPRAGIYGVLPLHNKTQQPIATAGSEDLMIGALSDSGCYTIVERDKLTVLIEEMSHCNDDSANKEYFDCSSFAKKGHLLGVTQYVAGDIVAAEPNIKGAELALKLPGVGGIQAETSYGWMQVSMRIINVETGKLEASTVVNAFVDQQNGGLALQGGGFDLKASAYSKTPQGCALQGMIAQASQQLQAAESSPPAP